MLNLKSTSKILKTLTYKIIVLSFAICVLSLFSPAYAACNPGIAGDCPAGLKELEDLFSNIISVIVSLGFLVMFIMLIRAGIKYLTSGGDPKSISAAHQTVTWALLGIVFMAVAWLILQLIKEFTGINVTLFNLKVLF